MLVRLLKTYLRPYKRLLTIVVILQTAQTFAALYLPSLNADIIDKGVVTGDTGYIWSTGALMLFVTLVQVVCAATRGVLRCQGRHGLRTRCAQRASSIRSPTSRLVRWASSVHRR